MDRWNPDRILSSLRGEVEAMELVRRQCERAEFFGRTFLAVGLVFSFWLGLLTASATRNGLGFFIALPLGFGIYGLVKLIFFSKGRKRFARKYKSDFLSKVVQEIEPELKLSPEQGLDQGAFIGTKFFNKHPDRYSSEDLFTGKMGKTQVCFSEIHAEEKKVRSGANGTRRIKWETIFKGILFVADFHKHFQGEVTVMPDRAEAGFGWLGRKWQKLGGDLQVLEDPEFEKRFVVRGKDAVQTRYLLTSVIQEALVGMSDRCGRNAASCFPRLHGHFGFLDGW